MSIISRIKKIPLVLNEFNWEKAGGNFAKIDALWNRIFYGVSPEQYISQEFYKKNHRERRSFLSTFESYKMSRKMMDSSSQEELRSIGNKYYFNKTHPAYIHRDYLLCEGQSPEQIRSFIEKHGRVLVKEMANMQGKGIRVVTVNDEDLAQTIDEISGSSCLLEEFIRQHPALAEFNPSSVNTVRLGTVLDGNGKGHVVGACLRIGAAGKVVDNYHAGGVAYPIDVEGGFVCGPGHNRKSEKAIYSHPSSGKFILGFHIPNWELVKKSVVESAEQLDKLRFIGWDVAITEDGIEFVEANIGQDPSVIQLDQIGKRKLILGLLSGKIKS